MKIIKLEIIIILLGLIFIFGLNLLVVQKSKNNITIKPHHKADAILVLGAAVWETGPSPMLQERLDTGIELYKQGLAPKIIMSGDNTRANYDEVNTMKNYAINKGVPSKDIFMDHAGISTYDSVYRAKEIFQVNSVIIVTQNYHLYRSIYIAQSQNIKVEGVPSNKQTFTGKYYREVREVLARDKDFFKCLFHAKAKILGSPIPVIGNGDVTNDK